MLTRSCLRRQLLATQSDVITNLFSLLTVSWKVFKTSVPFSGSTVISQYFLTLILNGETGRIK